ncbi:unnamed protein product [Linum tenue]|uniref:Beta-amylase n=1 Tax=Linum tenue TaxID=586396 RepID=A0AAV0Q334_9ROSI|nr:unnamed protein product [Linum tenue]
MKASLKASAEALGNPAWGQDGPHDSGEYNQFPEDTGFFRNDGTWNTEYEQFFLECKHGVALNFTCMEMRDCEQQENADCSPQGLVHQVKMATKAADTELASENALERYDAAALGQVLATGTAAAGSGLSAFTYLRLNKRLFEEDN